MHSNLNTKKKSTKKSNSSSNEKKHRNTARTAQQTELTTQPQGKETNSNTVLGPSAFFAAPGPAPKFENNGRIHDSDWSKILIPRGTMKKFSPFLKNATDHVWAAPAS